MRALMGIVYGIFLALLFPHARSRTRLASGFGAAGYGPLSWILTAFALRVLARSRRRPSPGRARC